MGLTDLSTLSQLPCGKGSKAHLNDLSWYFLCQPLYNSLTELPLADPDDLNEKIDPVRVIRDDGNTSPVRALPTAHFVGSKFKGCFFFNSARNELSWRKRSSSSCTSASSKLFWFACRCSLSSFGWDPDPLRVRRRPI